MVCCGKIIKYSMLALAAFFLYRMYPCLMGCEPKTNLDVFKNDGWFGMEKIKANQRIPSDPTKIESFQLNITQSDLEDLRQRLQRSRFIDHIADTRFTYGFNSDYLKSIQQYWLQKYDWRKHEHQINSFPQFKTKIEGIDIHFLHVKPKSTKAKVVIPILLLHGWPGSFYENTKMIPLLLEPDSKGMAFEVVVPSIPGFGYSEAPHQPDFQIPAAARIFVKLMKRLGHDKYFAHGGDFGNGIARAIGLIYPETTRGLSLVGNFFQPTKSSDFIRLALAYFIPKYYFGENHQKQWDKVFPLGEKFKFFLRETGYMHIQATKPDTVGSPLVDSPIGLAAYILEKFSTWTNPANINEDDGKLTEKFTMDDLLTNIMIYWTSGNIASSQRFYYECFQDYGTMTEFMKIKINVPTSIIEPRHDFQRAPQKLVEPAFNNLIQFTEAERGGHFLAFEEPKLVADDIRLFVDKVLKIEHHQQESKKQETANTKHDEI